MSFSTLVPLIQYTGNGSTTVFAFAHKYYNDEDIIVVLTDALGVDTVQTITTEYTLSGKAADAHATTTGSVTMLTPPAGGGTPEKLTIYRKPALTQITTLLNTGAWYALPLELRLDLIVMMIQEHELQLGRTSQNAVTNTDPPPTLEALEALILSGIDFAALSEKITPVGADLLALWDSVTSTQKKLTFTNLATYLGTVVSDATAVHTDAPAEISPLGTVALADADVFIAEDASAGTAFSKVKIAASALLTYIIANFPAASTSVSGIQENATGAEITNDDADSTVTSAQLLLSKYGITVGTADPTVNDDVDLGFFPGNMMVNTATPSIWACSDNTDGAAVWTDLSAAGGGAGSDTTAIHDDTAGEIAAITENFGPNVNSYLLIEDASDSNNKKKLKIFYLPFVSYTAPKLGGNLDTNNSSILFDNARGLATAAGAGILVFMTSAGGNYFNMYNKTTGVGPLLEATGSDTNIDCVLKVKGAAAIDLISGGVKVKHRATAADTSSTAGDRIIGVTDTSIARIVTLAVVANQVLTIKDESGAAGTNNITVIGATGNVDGAASVAIATNYGSVNVYCDGINFFII